MVPMEQGRNNASELLRLAAIAKENLLPQKSKERYQAAFNQFTAWLESFGPDVSLATDGEDILLGYFELLSEKYAPSTLCSIYSMLHTTMKVRMDIDIEQYNSVKALLKAKNKGYESTKANVFTEEEIAKFITDAPDHIYLAIKVACIFGIFGACRTCELVNVRIGDLKEIGNQTYLVQIPVTKNGLRRSFTINEQYYDTVKKYQNIRPRSNKLTTDRFFVRYEKGRCVAQVIGKHTFTKMPREIATFLNLPDLGGFKGHSFRRTSATFLANAGGDMLSIKRLGGWQSDTVASGYVEDSLLGKQKTANLISSSIRTSASMMTATETTSATSTCYLPVADNTALSSRKQKTQKTANLISSSTRIRTSASRNTMTATDTTSATSTCYLPVADNTASSSSAHPKQAAVVKCNKFRLKKPMFSSQQSQVLETEINIDSDQIIPIVEANIDEGNQSVCDFSDIVLSQTDELDSFIVEELLSQGQTQNTQVLSQNNQINNYLVQNPSSEVPPTIPNNYNFHNCTVTFNISN